MFHCLLTPWCKGLHPLQDFWRTSWAQDSGLECLSQRLVITTMINCHTCCLVLKFLGNALYFSPLKSETQNRNRNIIYIKIYFHKQTTYQQRDWIQINCEAMENCLSFVCIFKVSNIILCYLSQFENKGKFSLLIFIVMLGNKII